jgi:hypothetical protein
MSSDGDHGEHPAPAAASGFRYAIRVEGMAVPHEAGGLTRLEGAVTEQAALRGLLNNIRDLHLTIVTLERLGVVDTVAPSSQEPPGSKA